MIDKKWFEPTKNTNFLIAIDPTQSLVVHTLNAKPYRTKIFEILITYTYIDEVRVTFLEDLEIAIGFIDGSGELDDGGSGNKKDPIYHCSSGYIPYYAFGYGVIWDSRYGGDNDSDSKIPPYQNFSVDILDTKAINDSNISQPNNSFLIEEIPSTTYNIALVNAQTNTFGFVTYFEVIDTSSSTKRWTLRGNQSGLIENGDVFYTDMTNTTVQIKFTVDTVTFTGTNTDIVTIEPIPLNTRKGGYIGIIIHPKDAPEWRYGTALELNTTLQFPEEYQNSTYYFVPRAEWGLFNLAKKRYPANITDYVDARNLLPLPTTATNKETLLPGVKIRVTGSEHNDGSYTVFKVENKNDGTTLVWPIEPIMFSKDPDLVTDGTMSYDIDEFDEIIQQGFCPIVDANALHTEVYFGEHLSIIDQDDNTIMAVRTKS